MPRFLIMFILLIFPLNIYSSEFNENLLKKGELFFKNKDYNKAEFFFDAYLIEEDSCEIRFKSAFSKLNTGKLHQALKDYSLIANRCIGKIQIFSYFYMAEIYLELNEPGLAMVSLSNIENLEKNLEYLSLAKYEKIWLYLRFHNTEKALAEIKKLSREYFSKFGFDMIEPILPELDKEVKSPVISGIYSIVPGGGYLYCKRYKDASYAFFLNALLGAATYEAFDNDLPVLGFLLGSITAGFYSGNIYGGIRAAKHENRIHREHLYNSIEHKFRKKNYDGKIRIEMGFGF